MKSIQMMRFLLIFIFTCAVFNSSGQKKTISGKSKAKNKIKYRTPTPIPADYLQSELLQGQYNFIWQFEHDTNLAAGVLFREEISFEQDSVIITQYYSKLNMHFYGDHANVQGKTGNNIYAVYRFKMPYHMSYETVSIMNYRTKKYEDYTLQREQGVFLFHHLKNLKSKLIYKQEDMVVGSTSVD